MKVFMNIVLCIFIVGLIYQCKKKDANEPSKEAEVLNITTTTTNTTTTIDTIYPNSYFPVYPGSFWHYIDSNGDTSGCYTSSTYQKVANGTFHSTYWTYDSLYMPIYNNIPIMGYFEKVKITPASSVEYTRILSDSASVGTTWLVRKYGSHFYYNRIIATNTTEIINSQSYYPTIVIEYGEIYSGTVMISAKRSYYTKDIGLIKVETLDIFSGPPTYTASNTQYLQSYFIND